MDIETISLLVPRGLITAVLAFEIVDAKGASFNFLPGLAFSVILLSNILMLVATVRRRGPATDAPVAEAPEPATELSLSRNPTPGQSIIRLAISLGIMRSVSERPNEAHDLHGSLGRQPAHRARH